MVRRRSAVSNVDTTETVPPTDLKQPSASRTSGRRTQSCGPWGWVFSERHRKTLARRRRKLPAPRGTSLGVHSRQELSRSVAHVVVVKSHRLCTLFFRRWLQHRLIFLARSAREHVRVCCMRAPAYLYWSWDERRRHPRTSRPAAAPVRAPSSGYEPRCRLVRLVVDPWFSRLQTWQQQAFPMFLEFFQRPRYTSPRLTTSSLIQDRR